MCVHERCVYLTFSPFFFFFCCYLAASRTSSGVGLLLPTLLYMGFHSDAFFPLKSINESDMFNKVDP